MNARSIFVSLLIITKTHSMCHLFKKFPLLKDKIAYIALCDLPTPVVKLNNLGELIGCQNLFMKRDDITGTYKENGLRLYGGNKPRKLEFLLADAMQKGAKTIITYGCAGSNHALATAVYAHELGFKTILLLKPQPNSHVVRHNLLLDMFYEAQLRFFTNDRERSLVADELLAHDAYSYLISTGGSNVLGVLGFVNAAYELSEQIALKEVAEPDYIYVATGSCATVAGLLLGLKLVGLQSKIVAVCVEPEEFPHEFLLTIQELIEKTQDYLRSYDSSFPYIKFPEQNLIINKNFCGTEYGLFIKESVDAMRNFKNCEDGTLEGTYSAKPVAAITQDASLGKLQDKTVLFWNTYCGIDYSYMTNMREYKKLPGEFHKYFEEDVQPLDN